VVLVIMWTMAALLWAVGGCAVVAGEPSLLTEKCNLNTPVRASFLELESGVGVTPKIIPLQQKFHVQCQCTEQIKVPSTLKIPMEIPHGVCAATEVKIATKEAGNGLSEADVKTAIGNPLKVKWAKVVYHHFSDWEGRTTAQILGVPGGDIAEFVNCLDAYEEMTNTYVRDTDASRLLRKYLSETQKISFYMMTDTNAVSTLAKNVDIDNLDPRQTPQGNERSKILDGLVLPENIGCRFLRGMVVKPEDYDLRKGLAESAIRAFYTLMWDKGSQESKKLRLVEVDGASREKAVVHLRTSSECTNNGIAPLVQPSSNDYAMYIVHEAAADVFRKDMAEFMADISERVDAARMRDMMNANGEKYVARAIQVLAYGMPVYEVSII